MHDAVEAAVQRLANANRVVVSTGAGISQESGIPTFRDAQEGLWAKFDPQELATERGFRADPARVWGWYAYRRERVLACRPNPGHLALVALESLLPRVTVVTQNIDGLHQEAGSTDVVELHGSIRRFKCLDRSHPYTAENTPEAAADGMPPPCPTCGSPLRPNVVWFGEMLPTDATERAWRLARKCDALLVVGTSGTVWPAAELPYVAREHGAAVIEVNPVASEVTRVADVFLEGRAGEALPRLLEALKQRVDRPDD
jgi:NAD-dependent deacetylase